MIAVSAIFTCRDHYLTPAITRFAIGDQSPVIQVVVRRSKGDRGHLDLAQLANQRILVLEVLIATVPKHRQIDVLDQRFEAFASIESPLEYVTLFFRPIFSQVF